MSKRDNANETWNLKFTDLFRGVSFHDDAVRPQIQVPDEFYQRVLDFFMERSYLNHTGDRQFAALPAQVGSIQWLRITHLPVNPSNDATYDLLGRWQGVLSTMHSWNYRLLFLLMRQGGETRLYLGTCSGSAQGVTANDAVEQLREAAHGSMPGIGIENLQEDPMAVVNDIILPLSKMPDVGAVTGIPAFRPSQTEKNLQTLDSLAFGIKDGRGMERDYAMLVVADPMRDEDIASLISRMRELGSEIHSDVNRSISMSRGASEDKSGSMGATAVSGISHILANVLHAVPEIGPVLSAGAAGVGGIAGALEKRISYNSNGSLSTEYLDKFAQYAEQLIDMHVERLKAGRSTGFWNTGVYVLGTANDVRTVTGMLRSIYSGKESFLEPIRIHLLSRDSGAKEIVSGFQLLPLEQPDRLKEQRRLGKPIPEWHLFGEAYQYLSTPINTTELSLATSLPRRDVPGLRFVRTAIRFASNPAPVQGDSLRLGDVVDMGVPQGVPYEIDPNMLVRHALITGVTGCGKSTTCQRLISELMARNIPVLIIEPAKDDYVRWALKMNEELPEDKQFRIYMPGQKLLYPQARPLEINLYQPAAIPGAMVNIREHSENMSVLLNACLPSEDVVPILIDETVERVLSNYAGEEGDPSHFDPEYSEQLGAYPAVDSLLETCEEVMDSKGYEPQNRENLKEVLKTRFKYLSRGTRGLVFNVFESTDYHDLFSRPAVINLSCLAGGKEKSLVMSLLLLALYEYRASAFRNDAQYRAQAEKNQLMHLTLIEEAHNVLAAVPKGTTSGDPRLAAGDLFSNILAEIRAYGEGIAVVDQIPTKLLPDVLKNTNLKICHRLVAPDDCEALSSSLALREEQKNMIPALGVGHAIVCGDLDDAATWVKMSKPPKKG